MLLLILKALMVFGLLRWLEESGEPLQCALIYTGGAFIGSLLFGASFTSLLILSIIRFGLATMYFYALHYLSSGPLFWLVAIVGYVIVLV